MLKMAHVIFTQTIDRRQGEKFGDHIQGCGGCAQATHSSMVSTPSSSPRRSAAWKLSKVGSGMPLSCRASN